MADNTSIAFGLKVDGVEQSIKSVKDLKSAITALQNEAESSDIGSEQYKNAIEQLELLNEQLKSVSQTEKQAAKSAEDLAKAEKEATKETQDLRKQFEVLEDELFLLAGQGKQNTKQFKDLTVEAAKLNKKIDEVNSSLGGNETERAAMGFSKLKDGLMNLDFKSVKEGLTGIKTALAATGVMLIVMAVSYLVANFDELSKGSGLLAKALQFVGAIIKQVTDGIMWLTDNLGLTNSALDAMGDATVENANKSKEALAGQTAEYDRQIAAAKAAGKSTIDLEIAKQAAIIETNKALIEQTIAYVKQGGTLDEEKKKLLSEQLNTIKGAVATQNLIVTTAEKEKNDKLKTLSDENKAANLEAIKAIEDAKIAAIKDEELRAFAKEVLDNERRIKDIAASKASNDLKNQQLEANEVLFQDNLTKINEDGAAKRKAIDDKAAADKATADAKALADRKIVVDAENAEKMAVAQLAILKDQTDQAALIEQLRVKREIALQDATLTATQKLIIDQQYENDVDAIKAAGLAKRKADEGAAVNGSLQLATQSLAATQQLTDLFFDYKKKGLQKGSKEEIKAAENQFKVNKALQIANAVVSGIQGVMAAYSSGSAIPIIGAVAGPAFAILAGISAAANIAKIASAKFNPGTTSAPSSVGDTGGAAPNIPAPPTISTPENNTNKTTSFDETGKNLNAPTTVTPTIKVTATVGVDEISAKKDRVDVLENQSTFK
ncbi:hypothetical protein UFOVP1393_49 [uncultured Caudovirales phage]|uniref:Uncharacterized protein n=1 Tax=uncultured Caudovirales phage TaxID=2100421 RepID=A0A6J5S6Z1_9CAUD|nr:hypothetical protein UFOVP1393_49 [uncultured Caudovirales phage]